MNSRTTTINLPAPLKARIAQLAKGAGTTPHAWMVDALAAQVALAELRGAFIAEAEASAAEIDAGGPLYAAKDVHAYIAARAAGEQAHRPRPVRRAPRR